MTGKEVVLVFAGAALIGGIAGVGGAIVASERVRADVASAAAAPDVDARFDKLEADLKKHREELATAQESLADAKERLVDAEGKLARAAAEKAEDDATASADADAGKEPGVRLRRRAMSGVFGEQRTVDLRLGGAMPTFELGDLARKEFEEHFAGVREGAKLRQLPEADRWDKAKDDLGLSWNQVEALKSAIAERDALMDESMKVEADAAARDGASITIRRLDPAKAQEAQTRYDGKVKDTLNEEQRKRWRTGGWQHAFGRSPGFASTVGVQVLTIDSNDAPDGRKEPR